MSQPDGHGHDGNTIRADDAVRQVLDAMRHQPAERASFLEVLDRWRAELRVGDREAWEVLERYLATDDDEPATVSAAVAKTWSGALRVVCERTQREGETPFEIRRAANRTLCFLNGARPGDDIGSLAALRQLEERE